MITIRMEAPDFDDLNKNVKVAVREGLVAGAIAFKEQLLPKRFTARAHAKYGWPAVTKKYAIEKASKKGHQKDNVWSGRFEKAVRTSSKVNGRSARKGGGKNYTQAGFDSGASGTVQRARVSIPIVLGGRATEYAANIRRKKHGYGKGANAQSARVKIQRTIPEDVALVASVAGPHTQQLLATDPRFRLKRKRSPKTIHKSKA